MEASLTEHGLPEELDKLHKSRIDKEP